VNVHECHVGKLAARELDRRLGVGRLADQLDLGLRAEQGLEHVPDGLLVIATITLMRSAVGNSGLLGSVRVDPLHPVSACLRRETYGCGCPS
jgi:hypothetical protein